MKHLLRKCLHAADRSLYRTGLRSTAKLRLPAFLVLGPGQCGTTWLHERLLEHPQIFLPPAKELHYFNRALHDMSLADYADCFAAGHGRICGEICPGYSVLRRDRVAFIRRIMPDVRLLLIVRDPIERSWSAGRRLLGNLGLTIEEFGEREFINYLHADWAYRTPDGMSLSGDYEPGLMESRYCRTIDHWLEFFPPEQIGVFRFDELRSAPDKFLDKACRHIGASPLADWPSPSLHEAVNRNPAQRMPEKIRIELANIYGSEMDELLRRHASMIR